MKKTKASVIIKKIRKQMGIKQQDLAQRIKVHYSTISYWETGVRIPSFVNIKALLKLMREEKLEGHKTTFYESFKD